MSPPAACLFDLDGLLLDTEPLHARAWQEAASRFGTNLGPTQLRQLRGRRRLDCAEQVLQWIAADGGRCEGAGDDSAQGFFLQRVPGPAGLAFARPFRRDRAAGLADEDGFRFGHGAGLIRIVAGVA
jgi:hypothetical protein